MTQFENTDIFDRKLKAKGIIDAEKSIPRDEGESPLAENLNTTPKPHPTTSSHEPAIPDPVAGSPVEVIVLSSSVKSPVVAEAETLTSTQKSNDEERVLSILTNSINATPGSQQDTVRHPDEKESMNSKSLSKHMREQHQTSGPGKHKLWGQNESGEWVRTVPPANKEKRKANGNISPADKGESLKKRNPSSGASPSKQ